MNSIKAVFLSSSLLITNLNCFACMQEKLDVMTLLVNERNVDQVLLEFKEYATEVDADFVRKVSD